MKLKKYEDLLAGLFFLAVALVYASQIPPIKRTQISPVDSAFLSTIVAVCMGGLALCQLYIAWQKWKQKDEAAQPEQAEKRDYLRALYTLGLALLYVVLFKPLGFMLSSAIYLTAQMWVLAPRDQRKPVQFLVISVITVAVVWAIFHSGLRLMLPNGILTGLF